MSQPERSPSTRRSTPGPTWWARALVTAAWILLAAPVAARAGAPEQVLNIYNWSDYIAPTTVPGFERASGVHVRYDTFDSNETLFAKMVAGDTGYDIVVPSSNWAAIDLRGGLLQPIDKRRIPNLANLNPALMKLLAQVDPGNRYLIPWMWGYVTVGINVGKVHQALGRLPMPANPWDLMFNPVYANRLKSCGISYLDSGGDIMEAAFNALHIPQATHDQADFLRAFAMLRKVRDSITEFSSSGYINDLASGAVCAAIGWSGDMAIAANRAAEAHNGQSIEVFPPTHGAVIAIDTMAIPAGALHVANAYAFINYRLQPAVCAADTNTVFYANPVPASLPMVSPAVKAHGDVFLSPAMMAKLIPPKVYLPEERHAVTRLFIRFKTGL